MSRPRIAAVTIGQTPRPDLLEPLLARIGADDVAEFGALDELTADRIPSARPTRDGAYPLTTRLRDGTRVTIDEADLAPLVQGAIDRAEEGGAAVTLLLCAGGFLATTARGALIRPFDAAVDRLRDLGLRQIDVLVPFAGQATPAADKWRAAGFEPSVLVGAPGSIELPGGPEAAGDAIVLDYVGHSGADVAALRARASAPVLDLGECGAEAAVAALAVARATVATAR